MSSILLFLLATLIIGLAGPRLSRAVDRLADLTGIGEAVAGAVFLGAVSSLPDLTTSVTAAINDHPRLAVSNAYGSAVTQLAFLAIADWAYRRANLEHAAASIPNMLQASLFLTMGSSLLLISILPEWTLAGVHPGSLAVLALYYLGYRLVYRNYRQPMWLPQKTLSTREDIPHVSKDSLPKSVRNKTVIEVAILGMITASAGWLLATSGTTIAQTTGISETLVGAILTAMATSLPELVTTVAAIRAGALTLAMGNIIGSNCFDALIAPVSDIFYRSGSIFHAVENREHFILVLALLMTSVLQMGLLHREEHGVANIGFESLACLVLYFGGMSILFLI